MATPFTDITSLTTVDLIKVIHMRPPQWGLFTTLFKRQAPSNQEIFEIHTMVHGQNAIPVVSNYAPGVMRQPSGWEAAMVKAPRFATTREFRKIDNLFKRGIGETIYDTPGDPFARLLAEDLDAHRRDHDYMLEIMCAQAAVYGKVTLYSLDNGSVEAKQIIDYKRPASHEINVSAADKWNAVSSDLVKQIEEAHRLIMEDCNGMAGTELIMGADAWNAFRRHADVKESIDNTKRLDAGSHIDLTINAMYRGQWNGINLYVYNGWYLDVDNTKKYYMPPKSALLITKAAENVIEYARPTDEFCEGPTDYFVRSYREEIPPSPTFTYAESRPLPICFYPAWSVLFNNVV